MDTQEFFSLVLPEAGLRCLGSLTEKGFKHVFPASNDKAAAAAAGMEKTTDVYFACASFLSATSRRGDNVSHVKSFWVDLDTKETHPESAVYANRREALAAVIAFAKECDLPSPMVVNSGGGLHAYWLMDEDIDPVTWRQVATVFKQVTVAAQLHADPARTSDIVSVLRPVGTTNHKSGEKVSLLFRGVSSSLAHFHGQLLSYLEAKNIPPQEARLPREPGFNDELSSGLEYAPISAEAVASKCKQVAIMRDTQGDVSYEHWRSVIGILKHCENGEQLAYDWSARRAETGHSQTDVKQKWDTWNSPPTTCARFKEINPEGCQGCVHAGKVNTPTVLGYIREESEHISEIPAASPTAPSFVIPEFPHGFKYASSFFHGNCMQYQTTNAEGEEVWMPFCETLFYPVSRLNTSDGFALEIEMHVKAGETRRFQVDCSSIAEGGKTLASVLGKHEIVALPKMKPQIDAYLAKWMDRMRQTADEINTYQHFGWQDDGSFLVGNQLVKPGELRSVLLTGNAAKKAGAFTPKGSLDIWKHVIETAYNRAGQESFQYLVMLAFAAPLFAMFRQYGGVTVYAHSEGTGVGKTTAERCGLSAWGNWYDLQLSDKKVTTNALWALVGTYANMPVLFDELTNMTNAEASDVVFSISSGRSKERLSTDGTLRDNQSNWSTILMASGNTSLAEKLGSHRINAEAEISRAFEFTCDATSHLTPNEANDLFPLLMDNYGHAGLIFAQYIVENYDKVSAALMQVQKAFNLEAGITQGERYWSALQASVLTALRICQKLDLVRFDGAALKDWIIERITENRDQRREQTNDPLEQFGRMLTDIWQGVLVTEGEGDLRMNAPARVVQEPRGPLTGRAIVAQNANEKNLLILNVAAIKEWCSKKGASAKEMHKATSQAGWVDGDVKKFSLGRGTAQYSLTTSQVRCWFVDLHKVGADAGLQGPVAQKLRVIASGEGYVDGKREGTGKDS